MNQQPMKSELRKKILYAASTQSHLLRFHMPYIEELRKCFDVRLMARGEEVDFPIPFEKSLISPVNLRAVRKIRRILRRERFDAVVVNTSLAAFLIRFAMWGMKDRPRVLNIVHGYLFADPPQGMRDRLLLLCERLTRRQTDGIAVMNAADFEICSKQSLCLGSTVMLRGMGFQLPSTPFAPEEALRRRYAPDPEDWLLTFVGELSERKNQSFLIRALEQLRRDNLPVRLLLVGEGGCRALLEAEIERLGLGESVFLIGNQEPVTPYLAMTDLYVSASRSEGLPFNLMEAMACGLPVIASDVKGQQDLLREAPDCLYPLENLSAFCNAVRNAIASGRRGIGAAVYPELEKYRLEAVFDENITWMKEFL